MMGLQATPRPHLRHPVAHWSEELVAVNEQVAPAIGSAQQGCELEVHHFSYCCDIISLWSALATVAMWHALSV